MDSPGVAPGSHDPFSIPAVTQDRRFDRRRISSGLRYEGGDGLSACAGVDVVVEDGRSDSLMELSGAASLSQFKLERTMVGMPLEMEWRFSDDMKIQGALRFDWPDRLEAQISPRPGFVREDHWKEGAARISSGEGFKLPRFFALAIPVVGSPDLEPETSRSMDAGLIQGFADGRFSLGAAPF